MKSTILTVLLAAAALSASANEYYVVIPIGPPSASRPDIAVALNGANLPVGVEGAAYAGFDFSTVLQVTGDANFNANNVTWRLLSGSLPAGLSLSADGKLTGTTTTAGTSSFQVQAAYKTKTGSQAYQVFVTGVTISLAPASLPAGKPGAAYAYNFTSRLSTSGSTPIVAADVTWSIQGALPDGLQFAADGSVGGVPTTSGLANITVRADYHGSSASRPYTLRIRALGADFQFATGTLTSHVFGSVQMPYSATAWRLTLTNEGLAAGTLPTPVFGGDSPNDFSLTSTCSNVAPSSVCNVDIKFKPTQAGLRSSVVTIAGTTFNVTGTGLAAN